MALSRKRHQLYWLERGRAQNRPLPCCLLILIFCFVFIANPTVYCLLFPSPEKLWPSNNIFIWDTLNSRRDIVFVWSLSQVYCSLPFKLHALDITPTTTMTMLPHATTAIFQLNTRCDSICCDRIARIGGNEWNYAWQRLGLCCAVLCGAVSVLQWNGIWEESVRNIQEKKKICMKCIYIHLIVMLCVCAVCVAASMSDFVPSTDPQANWIECLKLLIQQRRWWLSGCGCLDWHGPWLLLSYRFISICNAHCAVHLYMYGDCRRHRRSMYSTTAVHAILHKQSRANTSYNRPNRMAAGRDAFNM